MLTATCAALDWRGLSRGGHPGSSCGAVLPGNSMLGPIGLKVRSVICCFCEIDSILLSFSLFLPRRLQTRPIQNAAARTPTDTPTPTPILDPLLSPFPDAESLDTLTALVCTAVELVSNVVFVAVWSAVDAVVDAIVDSSLMVVWLPWSADNPKCKLFNHTLSRLSSRRSNQQSLQVVLKLISICWVPFSGVAGCVRFSVQELTSAWWLDLRWNETYLRWYLSRYSPGTMFEG